jgi:hypothetical protein
VPDLAALVHIGAVLAYRSGKGRTTSHAPTGGMKMRFAVVPIVYIGRDSVGAVRFGSNAINACGEVCCWHFCDVW